MTDTRALIFSGSHLIYHSFHFAFASQALFGRLNDSWLRVLTGYRGNQPHVFLPFSLCLFGLLNVFLILFL